MKKKKKKKRKKERKKERKKIFFFDTYLHQMFIKYSEEHTYSNFGILNFLQIKISFYNKSLPPYKLEIWTDKNKTPNKQNI